MDIVKIYRDAFSGLNRDIWLITAVMFVNRLGTLILPFITLYTTQEIGWTKPQAGIAVACFGAGSLAGSYLGGWLTDKIGYYKVFLFSLIGGGLAYYMLQFFTSYLALSLGLFVASTIADLLRPALYTGIRFFTDDNTQTRAVSLLRMAFNLGFIIGPAIGGVIIALTSYKWIFILDAFTCWGAAIMTYFLIKDYSHKQFENKEEEIGKPIEVKNPYRDKPYLLFLFYSMLMLIGFFQILFTVPLYLEEIAHFSTDQIGFFFGINGAIVFILEMPLVQYVDKRKIIMKAMVAGSVMIGVGLLALLSQSYILLSLTIFLLLSGVGEIVNFPFISTTALKRATDQNSGKMLAMTSVMFSVSLIIAPPLGTMILEHYGYTVLWVTMAALCFISAIGLQSVRQYFKTV